MAKSNILIATAAAAVLICAAAIPASALDLGGLGGGGGF